MIFRRTEVAKVINDVSFYNGPRKGHAYILPGGKPGKTEIQSNFLNVYANKANIDVNQLEKQLVKEHGYQEHLRTDQITISQKDSLKKNTNNNDNNNNDNNNNNVGKRGRPKNGYRKFWLTPRLQHKILNAQDDDSSDGSSDVSK